MEEHFEAVGMSIVGYYHANERHDDAELSNAAKKIGDHIFRYFPRAAVLLVNICLPVLDLLWMKPLINLNLFRGF